MACVSCLIIQPIEQRSSEYAKEIFEILSPSCQAAFGTFIVAVLAWMLLYEGVIKANFVIEDFITKFFLYAIILTLLSSYDNYNEYINNVFQETISALGQSIIGRESVGADFLSNPLVDLHKKTEKSIWKIFEYSRLLLNQGNILTNAITFIAGLLLAIPYVGLLLQFTINSVYYITSVVAMTCLAPIFIVCAAFSKSRSISSSAFRIMLHAGMTLIISLLFMGFGIFMIEKLCEKVWLNGGDPDMLKGAVLFSAEYLGAVMLGYLLYDLMKGSRQLAYSLVGGVFGFPSTPRADRVMRTIAGTQSQIIKGAGKGVGKIAGATTKVAAPVAGRVFQAMSKQVYQTGMQAYQRGRERLFSQDNVNEGGPIIYGRSRA
jgi:hypothetical protein